MISDSTMNYSAMATSSSSRTTEAPFTTTTSSSFSLGSVERESGKETTLRGSGSGAFDEDVTVVDVPSDHGIMIRLSDNNNKAAAKDREKGGAAAGVVNIEVVPDVHKPEIHPDCHVPSSLRNTKLLCGGGSGTTVFGGRLCYDNNPIEDNDDNVVLKHGSGKDCTEVMSLVTVREQLFSRRRQLKRRRRRERTEEEEEEGGGRGVCVAEEAVDFLKDCLPEFVFVYISSYHVRNCGLELWYHLKKVLRRDILTDKAIDGFMGNCTTTTRNRFGYDESSGVHGCGSSSLSRSTTANNRRKSVGERVAELLERTFVFDGNAKHHSFEESSRHSSSGSLGGDSSSTNTNLMSDYEIKTRRSLAIVVKKKKKKKKGGCGYNNKDNNGVEFDVTKKHVNFILPNGFTAVEDRSGTPRTISTTTTTTASSTRTSDDDDDNDDDDTATEFLKSLSKVLSKAQDKNMWKVTLGQKKIGCETSENAAYVLTSGRLTGTLRMKLIDDFTKVVNYLRFITLPSERDVGAIEQVETEFVDTLRVTGRVEDVSSTVDSFVGSCILKNFLPGSGRIPFLREMGAMFRDEDSGLKLTDTEVYPDYILGKILERNSAAAFKDVFVEPPGGSNSGSALDHLEENWLGIIERAVSFKDTCPAAVELIWTCGLTDAGLQNLFLCKDRGLDMFDLGKPKCTSLPAFLTKFLMSFFHVFGMEEEVDEAAAEGGGGKTWVNRFVHGNNKLSLSPETRSAIPYVYDAFTEVVDSLIDNVFGGDTSVRALLIRYVVLQLFSDASFCLGRWRDKGGGSELRERSGLDKWLWRSIWDIYMATHVYETFLLLSSDGGDQPDPSSSTRWEEIRQGKYELIHTTMAAATTTSNSQ